MQARSAVMIGAFCALMASGCIYRQPFFLSSNTTAIELEKDDIVIQGPTQGTSSSPMFLGIQFGAPSYMQAEKAALDQTKSDVLLDRVRYDGFEGIYVPLIGFYIGSPTGELFILGSHTYYVQGVGAKFTR